MLPQFFDLRVGHKLVGNVNHRGWKKGREEFDDGLFHVLLTSQLYLGLALYNTKKSFFIHLLLCSVPFRRHCLEDS